jgi:hypothetical protein
MPDAPANMPSVMLSNKSNAITFIFFPFDFVGDNVD